MLRAPIQLEPGLANYSARDEFNQTAGNLSGKAAPVGGTWSNTGDLDDFAVETTGKTAERTAVSDTVDTGRLAALTSGPYALIAVQVDVKWSAYGTVAQPLKIGPVARYVSMSDRLTARIEPRSDGTTFRVKYASTIDISIEFPVLGLNTWYSIRLAVDAAGSFFAWLWLQGGSSGVPFIVGTHAALATGGTLEDGSIGFYDENGSIASTRNYDNFQAWVPTLDAVLHPNQSAQLGTDGMFREDSTGTAYGPVSHQEGGIPRMPPGGTTQVFLKGSRGDFDQRPDLGIDNISARAFYRPSWLIVPG